MANTQKYPERTELCELAHIAGKIMLTYSKMRMEKVWKLDNTPQVAGDRAVSQRILQLMEERYPAISVMDEEGDRIISGSEYDLVTDAIDGSIAYACGLPLATFCATLLKEQQPFIAVIHEPVQNLTWSAERGKGATLNGQKITVSDHPTVAQSLISLCYWHNAKYHMHQATEDVMRARAKKLDLAAVAICGGMIASGRMEASIFPGDNARETLAMALIVEEAGGMATDIHGNKLVYGDDYNSMKGHIISNGLIHEQLVEIVRRADRSGTL